MGQWILVVVSLLIGGVFLFLGITDGGIGHYIFGIIALLFGLLGFTAVLTTKRSLLRKGKEVESKTGFFKVVDKSLVPFDKLPGDGSYNSISESLGYSPDRVNTVYTFDDPIIKIFVFKRRTKLPIFFETQKEIASLSYEDLVIEINKIDWAFVNRRLDFEDGI